MSTKFSIHLSPQLASTYRLFLRATSAAVLHHPTATRNLRKLYRPVFNEAAQVEIQLKTTQNPQTNKLLDQWFVNWNKRIDNTLELFHNSATTRGLSHRLTRNIGFLTNAYLKSRTQRGRVWDPQLPATAPLYSIQPMKPPTAKELKQQGKSAFDVAAFQSLGQVARLAEAQSEISLGRLPTVSASVRR